MKYFRVKADSKWAFNEGVECYTDDPYHMPGLNCPVHPRLNPVYIDGHCYPAADLSSHPLLKRALRWGLDVSEKESEWQEQWKEPKKWRELEEQLLSALPYKVPITPGTAFGPVTVRLSGKPADWYQGFGSGHVFLAGSALEKLRAAGICDLFSAPCNMKSKRSREPYYELQIENTATLANERVADAMRRKYHRDLGYPLSCERCGREWGQLPKQLVLKGETIPENVNLFRLKNAPSVVLCTEAFAKAAAELKLTNLLFEPVRTDGSEKKRGLTKVPLSQPELWLSGRKTALPPAKAKKRSTRKAPPLPASAASLIAKARLTPKAVELDRLILPSIRLIANSNEDVPVGQSRWGGLPDLPKGVSWPGTAKAPLDFVLQISLSDVARHLPDGPLPETGLLSFFYDSENCPWGSEPKDMQGWKVLFYDGPGSKLVRASLPKWLSNDSLLPVCSIEFAKVDSLPALNAPAMEKLKFSQEERERYSKVLEEMRQSRGKELPIHKLLGHPDTVQNDMAIVCAMASAGLDANFHPDLDNPRQRKIADTAGDWTLLLQVDSEEELGAEWADSGRLFFWIRRQDLAARRFDRCWAVLQSY